MNLHTKTLINLGNNTSVNSEKYNHMMYYLAMRDDGKVGTILYNENHKNKNDIIIDVGFVDRDSACKFLFDNPDIYNYIDEILQEFNPYFDKYFVIYKLRQGIKQLAYKY